MGIKYIKNAIYRIAFPVVACLFFAYCSTNEEQGGAYCFNCITYEPDSAILLVKLSPNLQNPKVVINIYQGIFEPNGTINGTMVLIETDTVSKNEYELKVKTNVTYSVEAIYKSGNREIKAIDGGEFNRQEQTGCETTCWQLLGGVYDVRLKAY